MRKFLSKSILFILGLVLVFYINQFVFRTEFPMLIFASIPLSVIGLIWFPYIKFFKNKE